MVSFRNQSSVTNTPSVNISTKGADVKFLNIVNRHSAAIFVKFYDSTVATFQDTPSKTFEVAANSPFTLGWVSGQDAQFSTSNGLCVRAVTGATDNDNTAPATLPIIELNYNY